MTGFFGMYMLIRWGCRGHCRGGMVGVINPYVDLFISFSFLFSFLCFPSPLFNTEPLLYAVLMITVSCLLDHPIARRWIMPFGLKEWIRMLHRV